MLCLMLAIAYCAREAAPPPAAHYQSPRQIRAALKAAKAKMDKPAVNMSNVTVEMTPYGERFHTWMTPTGPNGQPMSGIPELNNRILQQKFIREYPIKKAAAYKARTGYRQHRAAMAAKNHPK